MKNPEAFAKRYGDYYVVALQLGGETGVCLTLASDATTHEKTAKVSVTAHVLLWDKTEEHAEHDSDFFQREFIEFSGYDTLSQKFENMRSSRPEEKQRAIDAAGVYLRQAESLIANVDHMMDRCKLHDSLEIGWDRVMEVCISGIVSQVVLMPYCKLPEYVQLCTYLGSVQ